MVLPELHNAHRWAFFFDFDGTLTEIAERPDAVQVEHGTRQALVALHEATSGALAIITGREIETVDHFLAPLKLPIAGVHGFERRNGEGLKSSASINLMHAETVEGWLTPVVQGHDGLLLEKKRGALALHYRQRPELEAQCVSWMEEAAASLGDVVLTRGKMVIEARFHHATKGTAIFDFLTEKPFLGRVPVVAGDDATDEDAFQAANVAGGISIKVGPGETIAKHRVESVAGFLTWLTQMAANMGQFSNHG